MNPSQSNMFLYGGTNYHQHSRRRHNHSNSRAKNDDISYDEPFLWSANNPRGMMMNTPTKSTRTSNLHSMSDDDDDDDRKVEKDDTVCLYLDRNMWRRLLDLCKRWKTTTRKKKKEKRIISLFVLIILIMMIFGCICGWNGWIKRRIKHTNLSYFTFQNHIYPLRPIIHHRNLASSKDGSSYIQHISILQEIIPIWFHRTDRTQHTLLNNLKNDNLFPFHSCDTTYHPQQEKKPISITLVIQTSMERLFLLQETCQHRWKHHPIIIVVYTHHQQQQHEEIAQYEKYKTHLESICKHVTFLTYTPTMTTRLLLQQQQHDSKDKQDSTSLSSLVSMMYPINELRNIGLEHVQTSHVLVLDIDFIPSMDLDLVIEKMLFRQQQQEEEDVAFHTENKNRIAWVIPALEYKDTTEHELNRSFLRTSSIQNNKDDGNPISLVPQNIQQLYTCYYQEKKCSIFQDTLNWEGHSTTRTETWLQYQYQQQQQQVAKLEKEEEPLENQERLDVEKKSSNVVKEISSSIISCFDSPRYEPYIVIPWCSTTIPTSPWSPFYDERFYGYGKNKIQYVQHVRFSGYEFHVLPMDGYIIHYPHEISKVKDIWNRKEEYDLHEQMDRLYPQFLQELSIMYPRMDDNNDEKESKSNMKKKEYKTKYRVPYCS